MTRSQKSIVYFASYSLYQGLPQLRGQLAFGTMYEWW